jgi:hypothetical protein
MIQWKLQSYLLKFLPNDISVSYSARIFGLILLLCLAAAILGRILRRRWLSRCSIGSAGAVILAWGVLYAARPAWLRIALQPDVPMPSASALRWETRSPGLETAELELRVKDAVVDRMALVRLDPARYRFSVHWDTTASRTAEEWRRELGAAVVVNGSYFGGEDHAPLTPLRLTGKPAGPSTYQSTHGAFVADGEHVDIIDLRNRDVFETIGKYPEAMVSYPLLIDAGGENRAVESKVWLASRNFVALDVDGHVVLGTTETGFFTLHRLGDFLKTVPLGLRVALNFDGGPLVSQVVRAGDFTRDFHGTAEMSDGGDVLRAFWHAHCEAHWTLPVVLVAVPAPR